MEEEGPCRGDLAVEGDRIAAVTPLSAPPPWEDGTFRTVDASGLWILPGFVQTHIHLCQSLFRGMAEGRNLYRWLSEVIWPLEAAHDEETIALSAEAGIRELLSGGTTAILDMGTTHATEPILATAARLGIRGFFGPALMDRGPDAAGPLLRDGKDALRELSDLAARWEGGENGRIRLALCPRFVPSVSDGLWRDLAEAAEFSAFPIHTHGSETREEVREVEALTGRTPPGYLARLPRSRGRVKMAHGVWLNDEDRRAMNESGVACLHCPGSNLKLGSGLADARALRSAGVAVGLGADGAACNNNLDIWSEMRLAACVESVLHGPEGVSAAAILRLATIEGARVLGCDGEVGSLRPGKRADLVLCDPHRKGNPPAAGDGGQPDESLESPETFLVFSGSRSLVRETWVDGRRVYRRDDPGGQDPSFDGRVRAARRRLLERVRA